MMNAEVTGPRERPKPIHSRLLASAEAVVKQLTSSSWLRRLMYFAAPALVLVAIWFSVIKYYYVPTDVLFDCWTELCLIEFFIEELKNVKIMV